MKKVLLTTTALVMTAGVAAAEVSLGGKVQTAMTASGGGDMSMSTHVDLNASISMTADNGVSMSTSIGYDSGIEAQLDDFENDDESAGSWGVGAPEVAVSYEGFTITAQRDGVNNPYDGDIAAIRGDLGIAGSVGGVSFAFVTDNDTKGADGVDGNVDDTLGATSYSVSYAAGDLTVGYVATSNDGGRTVDGAAVADAAASKISVSYKMGDATLTAASDNAGGADTSNSVGVSYAMGDITVGYTAAGDFGANMGDDYDLSLAYSAGALSASFATNETSRTRLVAQYDLGGATAFFASQQGGSSTEYQAIGVNFNF